jgi:hypothetical protein
MKKLRNTKKQYWRKCFSELLELRADSRGDKRTKELSELLELRPEPTREQPEELSNL